MSFSSLPVSGGRALELQGQDFQGLLRILLRRKLTFLLVFGGVLVAGIIATMLTKPVYRTVGEMALPTGASSATGDNAVSDVLPTAVPDSLPVQVRMLQSPALIREAEGQAHIVPRPGAAAPVVSADVEENTSVAEVTVEGSHPQAIADLANRLMELHLKETDAEATTSLREAIRFLQSEKERAARSLAEADRKLLKFREAHQGVDLSTERAALAGEHSALEAKALELAATVTTLNAEMANLRVRLAKEPLELAQWTTRENPRYRKLQDKLDDLQLQRLDLLRDYRPASRQIQDVDREISRLQQRLDTEPSETRVRIHTRNQEHDLLQTKLADLEGTLQGAEQNYGQVIGQLQAQRQQLNSLGPWEAELSRLTRERDLLQEPYTALSEHLRDLETRARAHRQTGQIITRAFVPTVPVRPHKASSIALSAVLALMLAAGVVFLQEHMDDRIDSPERLQRACDLTTLGQVPVIRADQPALLEAMPPNSYVTESYRALRSNIGFAGLDAPIRRLQVASAVKGEGKTMTAVNLAMAMARDGKRVILVDTDLRCPSMHQLLGVSNEAGLSEVLLGAKSVDEVIQPTAGDSLRVITAGAVPPNPTELLGSPAFDQVLAHLEAAADILIFDSAPALPVIDSVIVASRMDAVLLVVRAGETRQAAIGLTMDLFERARARIAGVVFNQVPPDWRGYYYRPLPYDRPPGSGSADESNRGSHRNGRGGGRALPAGKSHLPGGPVEKDAEGAGSAVNGDG